MTEWLQEIVEFGRKLLEIPDDTRIVVFEAPSLDISSECVQLDDGSYVLFIEAAIDYDRVIECVAHELTHVQQYVNKDLVILEDHVIWRGQRYDQFEFETDEYFNSPWERDARANEAWIRHRWNNELHSRLN